MPQEKEIANLHRVFAEKRGPEKTYCPSEVAKALLPNDWRSQMEAVRSVADKLIDQGYLEVLQKGIVLNGKATDAIGPIRLRKKK